MIYAQSFQDCLRLIIISEDESATTFVTNSFFGRWCIRNMVCCSKVNACSSSGHTVDNIFIRYFYIDCIINLLSQSLKCFIKCLCLRDRTRKSIQHVSIHTVILIYSVHNQVNNQFIRYKESLIHISLCLLTKFCSVLDVGR